MSDRERTDPALGEGGGELRRSDELDLIDRRTPAERKQYLDAVHAAPPVVVPDLAADKIDVPAWHGEVTHKRSSVAQADWLYFIAENDRPEGVSMQEIQDRFSLGRMAQGRVALGMSDAVRLGYAWQVAPRTEQFRWRVSDEGLVKLGLSARVAGAPLDLEAERESARRMHATSDPTIGIDEVLPSHIESPQQLLEERTQRVLESGHEDRDPEAR